MQSEFIAVLLASCPETEQDSVEPESQLRAARSPFYANFRKYTWYW